jgi:hypothetical protein
MESRHIFKKHGPIKWTPKNKMAIFLEMTNDFDEMSVMVPQDKSRIAPDYNCLRTLLSELPKKSINYRPEMVKSYNSMKEQK